jgi:hypothetical protein
VRRFLITAAFVAALPGQSIAQAAATTPAAQQPAQSDSAPEGPSGFTFRVGGIAMSGERNTAFNNSTQGTTGTIKGVDFLLRGSGAGISGRSMTGVFGGDSVISADVNLLLGPPAFTVSLGASKRALSSKFGTQVYTFGRVGLQLSFLIGGTGLRAQVGGWGLVPQPSDSTMKIGAEGEGSIIYTPSWAPIYLQFGYRNEVFNSQPSLTIKAPEEVRGLRLGAGIQFGGK